MTFDRKQHILFAVRRKLQSVNESFTLKEDKNYHLSAKSKALNKSMAYK